MSAKHKTFDEPKLKGTMSGSASSSPSLIDNQEERNYGEDQSTDDSEEEECRVCRGPAEDG